MLWILFLSYFTMYHDINDKKYNLSSQIKNGVDWHWQGVDLTLTLHIFVNYYFDLLKGIMMNNVHHKTQLFLYFTIH